MAEALPRCAGCNGCCSTFANSHLSVPSLPLQWCLYWEARRPASREPPPILAAAGGGAGAGGLASGAPTGSLQQPGTARAGRPAEDEADSAAVKRKRTAEEEAAAQHLKGISAESKKRLLEVSALSLTGTALEASRGVGGRV